MAQLKLIKSQINIYNLQDWTKSPDINLTNGLVQHIKMYEIPATHSSDFSGTDLIDKAGYQKGDNNGLKFYYKELDITMTITKSANAVIDGTNRFTVDCDWNLAPNLQVKNGWLEVRYTLTSSGSPIAVPFNPRIEQIDGGAYASDSQGRATSEKIIMSLFGGDRQLSKNDLNVVKTGSGSPSESDIVNAWKTTAGALTVSNNVITANYEPIRTIHPDWNANNTDVTISENNMKITGFKWDYTANHCGQHGYVNLNNVSPAPVEIVTTVEIFEKVNCGCVTKVGDAEVTASGDVKHSSITGSKWLQGNLTGNVNDASSLGGLTVTSTCNSPISIRNYSIDSCGDVVVNIDKPEYRAHFVDEKGCDLYINGAHEYDTSTVCDKNSPKLDLPMPNGWEAVTKGGSCSDSSNTGCAKVEWSNPDKCNVVTKKIFIKHKQKDINQHLDVNWYDNCQFRGHLGTITRTGKEDQVTGERTYGVWDNSGIKFDCEPFKGRFEQMGSDNNGEWRPLLVNRGWELLRETINCDCGELRVEMMYLNAMSCDPDLNRLGICQADAKPINAPIVRNNLCDDCEYGNVNLEIKYNASLYRTACNYEPVVYNTSNCSTGIKYNDTYNRSNCCGSAITTDKYNTSNCNNCGATV